jgi:diadenosine tetraphosphate (Ap4A) HIT family hydrolase
MEKTFKVVSQNQLPKRIIDPECLFCKIVQGDEHAHIIWEDENHMAFLSIFPNTPGTTVVIPKNHKHSYIFSDENTDQDMYALMNATKEVARVLDCKFEDVGRSGVVFEGFGVNHLHAKLYPMHGTKSYAYKWEPITYIGKYTYKYQGYISSHEGPRISDEELSRLRKKLTSQGDRGP